MRQNCKYTKQKKIYVVVAIVNKVRFYFITIMTKLTDNTKFKENHILHNIHVDIINMMEKL